MIVKILGAIDLAGALALLVMIFGINVFTPFLLACSGLLFLKGLFILQGNILSLIDLFACGILLISLLITPALILLWIPAFLLLAKGVVSFI